jgi:FkbM family methyltransferase
MFHPECARSAHSILELFQICQGRSFVNWSDSGELQMLDAVRHISRRLGVYESLRRVSDQVKWSKSFEYLYDFTHPRVRRFKRGESSLFRQLVPNGSLCFDVGANIGDKTSLFTENGSRVIAIEPVPRNREILGKRFGHNASVTLLCLAVSDRRGRATLQIVDDNTSFSSFSTRWVHSLRDPRLNRWGLTVQPPRELVVDTTTLDALIVDYGKPYYVKVDVEGHEVAVLRGLSQMVPLVSFEANLPEFLDETQACVRHLASLEPAAKFNYTTESQDRLELAQWLRASEFSGMLASTSVRFMEIYCMSASPC